MKYWIAVIVALGLVVPVSASNRVPKTNFESITRSSQVIVVADVTQIVDRSGVRVAVARVVRGLKGAAPNESIEFVAEGTWACDVSNAVIGERVLLFLREAWDRSGASAYKLDLGQAAMKSRSAGRVLYEIVHAGQGRILINRSNGGDWLAVEKRSENLWYLNANVTAPKQVKVFKVQAKADRPSNAKGRVLLKDMLAIAKATIEAQRLKNSGLISGQTV
ncbi:MAG: hypothetical protein IH944_13710 [Armatimonadetes bacterium]|nr:hypothetical protein [Armatimonadota bacterium]